MSKVVVIEKIVNNTSTYKKIKVKYLSQKQRYHFGITKNKSINKSKTKKPIKFNNNDYLL